MKIDFKLIEQSVFDRVAKHLLKQNEQSIKIISDGQSSPVCMYKGPNGLKCAIGCLIPEDRYDPSFELQSVNNPAIMMMLEDVFQFEHSIYALGFLNDLQLLHDSNTPDMWSHELMYFAGQHQLHTTAIKQGMNEQKQANGNG